MVNLLELGLIESLRDEDTCDLAHREPWLSFRVSFLDRRDRYALSDRDRLVSKRAERLQVTADESILVLGEKLGADIDLAGEDSRESRAAASASPPAASTALKQALESLISSKSSVTEGETIINGLIYFSPYKTLSLVFYHKNFRNTLFFYPP